MVQTMMEDRQPQDAILIRFLDHVDGFSEHGVRRGCDGLFECSAVAAEEVLSLKDPISAMMLLDG